MEKESTDKIECVPAIYKKSIEAVLDRLPTAQILNEKNGVYTVSAEVLGDGIDMWLRNQGNAIQIIN